MYCEDCQKRPATVHLIKIINGNKIEKHLCEHCAKKRQEQLGIAFLPDFSFSNFLGSMLESEVFTSLGNVPENNFTCDKCGMTYSQFAHSGRMGCNKCYEYFGSKLEPLLKRIHGNIQHVGKIPKRTGEDIRLKQELAEAKMELQKAVFNEEFELAAKLRDRIKELEKEKNH